MICGIGSNSSISEAWCGRGCGWLLIELRDGGTKTAKGHTRRAWSARSLNAAIDAWRLVLAYCCDRRDLAHNVAAPMHKVARVRREMATYTPEEIGLVLRAADKDRNGHLWYLALSGFRRGEIAGLCGRYQLRNRHARIERNRVRVGASRVVEGEPKTQSSRRTLPMDAGMACVLKRASARYTQERLALGAAHADSGYVACDEAGEPYTPGALTNMWHRLTAAAGVYPGPAARRPPFVRHGSAFAGSADGRDRQVAGAHRPVDHREDLCPLAG